jgi:biopolymer transport protein TolQ
MGFLGLEKSILYQMITHVGPMAKFVLVLLLLMSLFSWAIMINRWFALKKIKKQARGFLQLFWHYGDLKSIMADAKKYKTSPQAMIFQSAMMELRKWVKENPPLITIEKKTIFESCMESMRKTAQREYFHLRKGLGFLATVGNTAPFIGLFGTVWGIMRAFHDIGVRGSASLADVAPGISEALIATAFGLAAAIPAVIGYNYFTQRFFEQRTEMENFITDFLNRLKITYWNKGQKHENI